jgi:hypothetical protein
MKMKTCRTLFLAFALAIVGAITTPTPSLAAYVPTGDVVATGSITTRNLVPTGTATAASAVEISMNGRSGVMIQVTGTYTASGGSSIQGTVDGTNWITLSGASLLKNVTSDANSATITSGGVGVFQMSAAGFVKIRVTPITGAVTGTMVVTINANPGTSAVVVGAPLPLGTNSIGNVATVATVSAVTSATLASNQVITPVPLSNQGASLTSHLIAAASTNATTVKASAGVVNTIQVSNINAAVRYLKLYNKATAPTVGTDTPVMTIMLPPGSNQVINFAPFGFRFSTGVSFALTTGMAVADTGAVSAAEHSVSFVYT